jgi:hypothetical protein
MVRKMFPGSYLRIQPATPMLTPSGLIEIGEPNLLQLLRIFFLLCN